MSRSFDSEESLSLALELTKIKKKERSNFVIEIYKISKVVTKVSFVQRECYQHFIEEVHFSLNVKLS